MQRRERVGPQRKALPRAQLRRQRLPGVADEPEHLRAELAQLLLRDVLARGIDRCEVGGLRLALEVVGGDRKPEAVPSAAKANPASPERACFEPRLVEPGRLDRPRIVPDAGGEDLQPAAPAARHRRRRPLDDRLLLAEEVGDPLRRDRLLVAPRPLPEEVAEALEPELREPPGDRGSDAVERLDGRLEPFRPRKAPRPRPGAGGSAPPKATGSRTAVLPQAPITIGPASDRAASSEERARGVREATEALQRRLSRLEARRSRRRPGRCACSRRRRAWR